MAEKTKTNYTVASLQPGSSDRRPGEAEEHLPRPNPEKEQRVQRPREERELPAGPPAPTASEPGSPGAERPPSHSQQQVVYRRTSELTSQLRLVSSSAQARTKRR